MENSQVGVTGNIITIYCTLNIFMKAYVLSNSIIKFSLTKNKFYKIVSTARLSKYTEEEIEKVTYLH